jgi:LuxR family transcriptional regulator, glucitol operon activator
LRQSPLWMPIGGPIPVPIDSRLRSPRHDPHHAQTLDQVSSLFLNPNFLDRLLEGLIPIRNRVMHTRPLEFDDLPRVSDLAAELVKSHRALWANLRTTRRERERDPEFATTLTIPDATDDSTKLLHNLPQVEFDDTGFVGREKELSELKRALMGGDVPGSVEFRRGRRCPP